MIQKGCLKAPGLDEHAEHRAVGDGVDERWRRGVCENQSTGSWCTGGLEDLGKEGGPGPFINPTSDNET